MYRNIVIMLVTDEISKQIKSGTDRKELLPCPSVSHKL